MTLEFRPDIPPGPSKAPPPGRPRPPTSGPIFEPERPPLWRQLALFGSGLALGAVALWSGMHFMSAPSVSGDVQPAAQSAVVGAATQVALPANIDARPVVVAAASSSEMACPARPLVSPAAGSQDGRFVLQPDLGADRVSDVAHFIVIGKEAAAGGRPRDAEVAFLMACRVAAKFTPEGSAESADARYQLARHYANAAQPTRGRAPANRDELLRHSQALYNDSAQVYAKRLGATHEKTRYATEGLANVRQALGIARAPTVVAQAPVAPDTSRSGAGPALAEEVDTKQLQQADERARQREAQARQARLAARAQAVAQREVEGPPVRQARPSFDCSRAQSLPEQLICSDPGLADLDRELGRLHARARAVTPDPTGFKRRNEDEWRRREATCRDTRCLQQWYAQRREQLLDEMAYAQGSEAELRSFR